jgi:hypothetical protein
MRPCWNSKSRTHPDTCCKRPATFGDFCSFHYKNPRRFEHPIDLATLLTRRKKSRLERFLTLCRTKIGLRAAKRQGPAFRESSLANNPTELASMDPLTTIWPPYRFSFIEGTNIWLFDVRSLLTEKKRLGEKPFTNPYTSVPISSQTLIRLQTHVQWLTRRRYSFDSTVLEGVLVQSHLQKIVELCLLIDSHGYLTNVAWFELDTVPKVQQFVNHLNHQWSELTLTTQQTLVPVPQTTLVTFHSTPHISNALNQVYTKLIEFLTNIPLKEDKAIATVYILRALVQVSSGARTAFAWLL